MSALDVFVTPDAAHLFTDGGRYDPNTMALDGFASKVAVFPELNAVLGSTGYSFIKLLMQESIDGTGFRDYDSMVAEFPEFLKKTIKFWSRQPNAPKDWGLFNIVIAGWSNREDGPTAHAIRGYGDLESAAFTLREMTRFRVPTNAEVEAVPFDPANPTQSGLAIMREQRRHKFESRTAAATEKARNILAQRAEEQSGGFQVVQGFCQHTCVDREGIHTKILERWN